MDVPNTSTQAETAGRETAWGSVEQVAAIDRRDVGSGGETGQESLAQRITAQLEQTMGAPGRAGKIWIGSLLIVIAAAVVAYCYQLANGLEVTAMREYVSWGVYITNFVF